MEVQPVEMAREDSFKLMMGKDSVFLAFSSVRKSDVEELSSTSLVMTTRRADPPKHVTLAYLFRFVREKHAFL